MGNMDMIIVCNTDQYLNVSHCGYPIDIQVSVKSFIQILLSLVHYILHEDGKGDRNSGYQWRHH